MKDNPDKEHNEKIITSPQPSEETNFSVSGNYYFSLIVKDNTSQVCFPVCSQNALFCFNFQDFLNQGDVGCKGWFGSYSSAEGTKIIIPPDRPGFYIEKGFTNAPKHAKAFSKIFWKIPHEVDSMLTNWSEYPVLYSNFGGSFPAIAFVERSPGIFVGIGDTPDRAILNAIHLTRLGVEMIEKEALEFYDKVRSKADNELLATNTMASIFLSNSRCIDSEENCIMASKSPEYYVSTGFWSRDFIFWTLPIIERFDKVRSKELVNLLFGKYWKNKGTHALYLDGRVLYDGFELDELSAYILAIAKAIDYNLMNNDIALRNYSDILEILERRKAIDHYIYSTDLNSSDDPVSFPYVTYNNVILWYSLKELSRALGPLEGKDPGNLASKIRNDINESMVIKENEMFCYSSDLHGRFEVYDDPTGSLILLPFFGFVGKDSNIYRKTVDWIKSKRNKFMINGRYPGLSNRHVNHPWVHYYASLLLVGDSDGEIIFNMPLDKGMACETISENSGSCVTGIHFPGSSGILSEAGLKYLGK